MSSLRVQRRIIPGFGLSLGYTVFYLSVVVLFPLFFLVFKSMNLQDLNFWEFVTSRTVMRAYWNSFLGSLLAALVNIPLGLLVAWVLIRYSFPGRRILDAIVDLPFALPTAVAGIALARLYSDQGTLGQTLTSLGFTYPWPVWVGFEGRSVPWEVTWFDSIGKTPLGIVAALIFIGLPFVVRTVQPVIEDMDPAVEEAAASLGASRGQTFFRIILPQIFPALLTGFALAFARGLGEFGSVTFITGGQAITEIAPEKIIQQLEGHYIDRATAIAVVMLGASFLMLLVINLLQRYSAKRNGRLA